MYIDTIAYVDVPTDTKALIRKAHDLIRDKGWIQSAYYLGGYCVVGALLDAAGGLPFSDGPFNPMHLPEEVVKAAKLLAATIGINPNLELPLGDEHPNELHIVRLVEAWNDNPIRTKGQVLRAMKKACA